MTETCTCSAAGFCERRKVRIPAIHWKKCQAGQVEMLDGLYAPKPPQPQQPKRPAQRQVSTIGTDLRTAIESATGETISCGVCLSYLRTLNFYAVAEFDAVVQQLLVNLPIPAVIRQEYKGQRKLRQWIAERVASVIPRPERPIDNATQFVWCYWHAGAAGDEIRWSVRSVETYFQGPSQTLIIGDRPPWYAGPVLHCPRIPASGQAKTFRPGLADVLNKLRAAVDSPMVAPEFVWLMDDTYFVRPVTLDELRVPRATHWKPGDGNGWQKVKTATMQFLQQQGRPQHDYATHGPHVVQKMLLRSVLEFMPSPMLWEVVYGNIHRGKPQPINPFLCRIGKRLPVERIRRAIASATVLNHDSGAWCPAMRQALEERLPNPASVEIGEANPPHVMIIQASYIDPELSRRRLQIARHTSVPSLAYQTRKPVVHIAVNPDDPHTAERIEAYKSTGCEIRVLHRPTWKLYGEDWELPEGRKIVSRMDDDDVICQDYCATIQQQAPLAGEWALIWPNGYVFWRQQIFQLNHPGIQFVSLVTDRMTDPHQEQHWGYHKNWPSKVVSHNVGWIWVRHGDAATSTLKRYRKHRRGRIDSKRIPINLRAIVRAIEESGTPSGDYTEHRNQQTLRHVLRENAAHAQ